MLEIKREKAVFVKLFFANVCHVRVINYIISKKIIPKT